MTKTLRQAIDALMKSLGQNQLNTGKIVHIAYDIKRAYQDHRANMTETSKRIEFLEECLEAGMSKREAARKLSEHDPRVGRRTAETLVYTNFSGQYQTTLRGRRKSGLAEPVKMIEAVIPDVSDDESIL